MTYGPVTNLQYDNKPVDKLARPLPSSKRPLLPVEVMFGMYDSILSNPANFTPPTRASLFYATRSKKGGDNCLRHEKCGIFVRVRSRVASKCFFSQCSKPNERIFSSASLKGFTRLLIRFLVSECDDFEHRGVTMWRRQRRRQSTCRRHFPVDSGHEHIL